MSDNHQIAKYGSKLIVAGAIILVIGIWLIVPMISAPYDELRLIRNGEVTDGLATDSGFVSGFGEANDYYEGWWVDYGFKFEGYSTKFSGRSYYLENFPDRLAKENLPQRVQVEYLISDPSINRLSGSGNQTISSWVKSNGALVAGILVWGAAVIWLLISGWGRVYNFEGNPLRTFVSVTFRVAVYLGMIAGAFAILIGFVSLFEWLNFGTNSFLIGLILTFAVCSALPVLVMILRDERQHKNNEQTANSEDS